MAKLACLVACALLVTVSGKKLFPFFCSVPHTCHFVSSYPIKYQFFVWQKKVCLFVSLMSFYYVCDRRTTFRPCIIIKRFNQISIKIQLSETLPAAHHATPRSGSTATETSLQVPERDQGQWAAAAAPALNGATPMMTFPRPELTLGQAAVSLTKSHLRFPVSIFFLCITTFFSTQCIKVVRAGLTLKMIVSFIACVVFLSFLPTK